MTPRRVDAAAATEAVAALPRDRAAFVGVDGFGGAGKTTFAARLAERIPGVAVVHVDDFQGAGVVEWDWDRMRAQVLEPLRSGVAARYQVWSWGAAEADGWAVVPAGSLVVIEGVSATRSELAAPWDLTIWVDAPATVRRRRTVERDGPGLRALWEDVWIPSEERYAARERPQERVDLIVSDPAGRIGDHEGDR